MSMGRLPTLEELDNAFARAELNVLAAAGQLVTAWESASSLTSTELLDTIKDAQIRLHSAVIEYRRVAS